MSAVATVLALMLFVSFLSTFVLGQLDAQMSQKEFQHELQVENQMLRFQDSLLESAAALSANGSTYASSPITLNSGGVPPFGTPSSGALQPDFTVSSLSAGLGLANVTPAPPLWNSGSPCFAGGNGTCSGQNGPALYWNFSGNHSTVTPGVNGCGASGCTIIYNISGSFDTITLLLRGNNLGNVLFVVFGNWDNMTLNYQGSCDNHRLVDVFMVGTNDTYKLNVGGCASGMGASLSTIFIGSLGIVCPYGNGVSTDRFLGASWGSSNGVSQNLTWRNAIGYVSAPHTIPTNGGSDSLTFANTTGYSQCPFTKSSTSGPYSLDYLSGVQAHLYNRYLPAATVSYADGAVIFGVENGGSVMVSPPPYTISVLPLGISLSLTLVNVLSTPTIATGFGTAAVISQVVSANTYHIQNGQGAHGSNQFLTTLNLSITTQYPLAWSTFWNGLHQVAPAGTRCVPGPGVTTGQCLTPQLGRTSTIVVPLVVSELYLTTITVNVSIY
ncbi:MAG TPA: hypothetical protein VKT21_06890 [Thermoplasmata archaeon]|nr:hypothetical protein [Thermoplasmata archaeon]